LRPLKESSEREQQYRRLVERERERPAGAV
jgi:hypothetical protein